MFLVISPWGIPEEYAVAAQILALLALLAIAVTGLAVFLSQRLN